MSRSGQSETAIRVDGANNEEAVPLIRHTRNPYYVTDALWWTGVVLVILAGMVVSFYLGWIKNTDPGSRPIHLISDFVVTNARVWTGQGWASAFAVKDNRFTYVGNDGHEALRHSHKGYTKYVDGKNELMVTPGFSDSHVHLMTAGVVLSSVQLQNAHSIGDFKRILSDFIRSLRNSGGVGGTRWVRGGNWDHTKWQQENGKGAAQLPEADWIDSFSADVAVWVCRLDGHMCLANSLAMRLANVSAVTADVEGGEIVRYANGTPTGVFKDRAMDLINAVVPPLTADEEDRALEAASAHLVRHGVTRVHDMHPTQSFEAFRRHRNSGRQIVRIDAAMDLALWRRLEREVNANGTGDDFLTIGSLKGYADGSLGSQTALMFEPYLNSNGQPGTAYGIQVTPVEDMYANTLGAVQAGLRVAIHAIGDRANSEVLGIFENVSSLYPTRDLRLRIEHAQHIRPEDIPRFARVGVIASVQPYHLIDDGRWADRILGAERTKRTAYPIRSLLDSGVKVAFGSDWFVAPPEPITGIYAAVTRIPIGQETTKPDGWISEQRITVEEALQAYTTGACYADFLENKLGKIAEGYLADFVILNSDLTRVTPTAIPNTKVLMTVVNGTVVYAAPGTSLFVQQS